MNDRIWTGEINRDAAIDAEVGFYDTTLRDGEQAVGVVLDPEQKLEIARGLDELGIERIEAGFPRVSADDERAFKLVLEAGLDAEIWGFSRAVPADLEALVQLGVSASVVESPISSAARSNGSGRTSPSTSTATTTSGSRRRRRSRPCAPARAGSTARSTAWASAPATRASARSR